MTAGLLDGVTVLDLASVGPAARASRWLADYGATVVKVGPVPTQAGVQITPPDLHGATVRIFIPRTALSEMTVLGVVGIARRKPVTAVQPGLFNE